MRIAILGLRGIPDVQGGIERHCQELYPRLSIEGSASKRKDASESGDSLHSSSIIAKLVVPIYQGGLVTSRTRQARFSFVSDAPAVGRSGELAWQVGAGLLPSNLISRRNGVLGVFLLDSGKARFEPLPGAQEGRPAHVRLPASSRVITLGRERLQDGAAVSVQQ